MKRQKAVKYLTYVFLIPFMLFAIFGMINSLLRTTYFDLYQYVEIAVYRWDNPAVILIISLAILCIIYGVVKSKRFSGIDFSGCAMGFAGLSGLLIVLLFRCGVKCDSEFLSDAAIEFLQGNYESFANGAYLNRYPFQLGMTAFIELFYRIFGVKNYIVFQLINVVCIVDIIGILGRITSELFEDKQTDKAEALLSFGMLPLFLYATFVYGDIIGWCMGINVVYFVIRYLKTDGGKEVLKAAVFLALGIAVKSNVNILLVAAVIAIALHSIEKRKYKAVLWAIGMVLISQLGVWLINGIYIARADLEEIPAGIPKIAWVAMSMQEPIEGGSACGWYNGYNCQVYAENGYDQAGTSRACMDNLKMSLNRFVHEKKYTLKFFYDKFTSQWNNPDFMSLITNEWYSRDGEPLSDTAVFFIYGLGRKILLEAMNIYHFIVFLCTGIFCLSCRKKWRLDRAYFVLNIFGGLLFHMLWEAKARYTLGYFVLMLPLAAYGCKEILCKISVMKGIRNRSENEI